MGVPDLVVANFSGNTVSVLLGSADTPGTFGTKTDYATGSNPFSVAIGDLNSDGRPDLVVANHGGGTVSVLLNTTAGPFTYVVTTPADDANDANCLVARCTLRQAVHASNAHDPGAGMANMITFDTTVFATPQTITLSPAYGQLDLTRSVTITGPEASSLTVARSTAMMTPQFRIFQVSGGVTATISGLTIRGGNVTGGSGGGILVTNAGSLTLTAVTVSGNTATLGGGVSISGTLTAMNTAVRGNTSGAGGGGLATAGTTTLTNSTVSGNTANSKGGGIYSTGGTLALTNVTVSGNTANLADGGGGIRMENAPAATLTNVTVSGNTAPMGSGGVSVVNTATLNATRTIIAGNTNGDAGGSGINGGTNTNNLVGGIPLLAPLADYGGPTQTQPPLPGSPAIDAGSNTACAALPVNNGDQRGVTRPVNATCDIGAVESRGFTLTATSGTPQSTPVGGTFTALTATVAGSMGEPVAGGTVTFALPASGASGVFGTVAGCTNSAMNTVATCTVNGSGVATSPTITANFSAGMYPATATASGVPAMPATTFALTNTPPTITLTPATLPGDTVGSAYPTQTLTAAGGTSMAYTYALAPMGGTLPPGLTLGGMTGTITGTPTMAGTFAFTVRATDGNGFTGDKAYTVTVNATTTIATTTLPNGAAGVAYSQTLVTSGGTAPLAFAVTAGSLPVGMSLNATTGTIGGTPVTAGMVTFTVTVTDANGATATRQFTLTVAASSPAAQPTRRVAPTAQGTVPASMPQPHVASATLTGAPTPRPAPPVH